MARHSQVNFNNTVKKRNIKEYLPVVNTILLLLITLKLFGVL